ncbi:MAG: YeeE/YedE family protein [Rhodospirillales bacterium]|nr:MAG: YeeE/YedE family protein [Rhodospirillales bacterium]
MSDIEPRTLLLAGGLLIGVLFGVVARWSAFCVRGAVEDALTTPDAPRLRGYLLAVVVALVGVQALIAFAGLDLSKTIYLSTALPLGGLVIGGLAFGVGMVLAGGCGARLLVLAAGGNLRSVVTLIVLGLTAYATLRGVLAPARQALASATSVDFAGAGLAAPTLAAVAARAWGATPLIGQILVGLAISIPILAYVARRRVAARHLVGGALVGLLVPAAFALTGIVAVDEFNPVPPDGLTVTGPLAQTLVYGLTYTGAAMDFGIAWALGIPLGAGALAAARGELKLEGFDGARHTLRYLAGGALMGVGGVLSLGCTVGQGLTGVSTLSIGSLIAIAAIVAGAAAALKWRALTASPRPAATAGRAPANVVASF